jgi:hypothetical protein
MRRTPVAALALAASMLAAACGGGGDAPAEFGEVRVDREPVIVVPAQAVAIDLDGDGVELVRLDGTASEDRDGEVVDYRWSAGLEDLAFTPEHTSEFPVGEHVVSLTVTDDDGLTDVETMVVRVLEPYQSTPDSPVIDLWLGAEMNSGDGAAQRWFDIPGNVSDPDGVASLIYSLNGEPSEGLALGPNDRRLVRPGDFVIDILRERLVEGVNTVEIRAADNRGEVTTALVEITNPVADEPSLPGEIDWSEQALDGLVEVVDGHWKIVDDELVIDSESLGYDRLLAVGDQRWTDFDVQFAFTVDEINEDFNVITSTTPGFGMLLRWNGHNESFTPGSQPQQGFRPDGGLTPTPYGAFPFYAIELDEDNVLEMQGPDGTVMTRDGTHQIVEGRTYNFRAQAQSLPGTGGSVFRAKLWGADEAEPDWMVHYVAGVAPEAEASSGSVVLVAHEVAITYGDLTITDVPEGDRLGVAAVEALRSAQAL